MNSVIIDFWHNELTPKQWERGLLKIRPKKGDLRLPGNYRGIMLLETCYKIVAIVLNNRLKVIEEDLKNHENQCGFRTGRGCVDAIFTVKSAVKKRAEHGLESWIMFLDLVKAFDRVPRELFWKILTKIGVPTKIVKLLQSLHAQFEITFCVNDVSNLFMYAAMLTWHKVDNRPLCVFYSKPDFTLSGRSYRARGGTLFSLPDSQYADDVAVWFISRESVEH